MGKKYKKQFKPKKVFMNTIQDDLDPLIAMDRLEAKFFSIPQDEFLGELNFDHGR